MNQEAILFNRNNAHLVAANLNDYTADELLEEYDWMFTMHTQLVLVRDVQADGFSSVSCVVTEDMFQTNAPKPTPTLNAETFTYLRTF